MCESNGPIPSQLICGLSPSSSPEKKKNLVCSHLSPLFPFPSISFFLTVISRKRRGELIWFWNVALLFLAAVASWGLAHANNGNGASALFAAVVVQKKKKKKSEIGSERFSEFGRPQSPCSFFPGAPCGVPFCENMELSWLQCTSKRRQHFKGSLFQSPF